MPIALLLIACTIPSPTAWEPVNLLSQVDVFVGSGGDAFGYGGLTPAAQVPNGLIKLGPDTSTESSRIDFQHTAGYDFDDPYVTAFSHYRLPGIGVGDGCGLGVMFGGEKVSDDWRDYRAPYARDDEEAAPGRYRLALPDRGQVELAAAQRGAIHRYTWETEAHWLMVNLAHVGSTGSTVEEGELVQTSAGLQGWLRLNGGLTGRGDQAGVPLYFVIDFSEAPVESELSLDGEIIQGTVDGPGLANLRFEGESVELRVGLSVVDVAGARANLQADVGTLSLEELQAQATQQWQAVFDTVEIAGGTDEQQAIFASALYHSRSMPTSYSDVDGRFRGVDGEIHPSREREFYSDFSGWDTYRTLHPWVIWVWPELGTDLASSIADMGQQLGYHPRWPAGTTEAGSMVGSPLEIVLAESALKGLNFDGQEAAFELAMQHSFDGDLEGQRRHSLQDYIDYGYIPVESEGGSVSKTQEMAIADHAMGSWAALRGDPNAQVLLARSGNFANVHDPETNQAAGRMEDGSFMEPGLKDWPDEYVEGNTYQYTWLAPHDAAGLADAFGGNDTAVASLLELFEKSKTEPDTDFYDPYYWHGNEPDLHAAFLFAEWGRPDLTQEWVGWIQGRHYALAPTGLDGNDDGGTLSAWYLFAAVGLYPLNGTDKYVLTAPLFDHVRIGGLEIGVMGQGVVRGVIVDGEVWEGWTITHAELTGAESLVFVLGG
ncbi:MAG: putative alpha-1,2-mannosidase [Cognaticolwellia sp.]|jgi:predicted alpha-1,2-mannosidase